MQAIQDTPETGQESTDFEHLIVEAVEEAGRRGVPPGEVARILRRAAETVETGGLEPYAEGKRPPEVTGLPTLPPAPPAEGLDGAVTPRMLWAMLFRASIEVDDATARWVRYKEPEGCQLEPADVQRLRGCARYLARVAAHADAVSDRRRSE